MELEPTSLPQSWIECHVQDSVRQYELLSSLAAEMVVDGYEYADLFTEEVFTLADLRANFGAVEIPSLRDCEGDDKRLLMCVFVLGVLDRWDEAFRYLGGVPGNIDRHNPDLFSDRLDVLIALSEHGRHTDVVEHGAHLALDSEAVLGETTLSIIVNTLRAESLARSGDSIDALRLFLSVSKQIKQGGYVVDECLSRSIGSHIEFLSLAHTRRPSR